MATKAIASSFVKSVSLSEMRQLPVMSVDTASASSSIATSTSNQGVETSHAISLIFEVNLAPPPKSKVVAMQLRENERELLDIHLLDKFLDSPRARHRLEGLLNGDDGAAAGLSILDAASLKPYGFTGEYRYREGGRSGRMRVEVLDLRSVTSATQYFYYKNKKDAGQTSRADEAAATVPFNVTMINREVLRREEENREEELGRVEKDQERLGADPTSIALALQKAQLDATAQAQKQLGDATVQPPAVSTITHHVVLAPAATIEAAVAAVAATGASARGGLALGAGSSRTKGGTTTDPEIINIGGGGDGDGGRTAKSQIQRYTRLTIHYWHVLVRQPLLLFAVLVNLWLFAKAVFDRRSYSESKRKTHRGDRHLDGRGDGGGYGLGEYDSDGRGNPPSAMQPQHQQQHQQQHQYSLQHSPAHMQQQHQQQLQQQYQQYNHQHHQQSPLSPHHLQLPQHQSLQQHQQLQQYLQQSPHQPASPQQHQQYQQYQQGQHHHKGQHQYQQ
jgi:hypothetical protein